MQAPIHAKSIFAQFRAVLLNSSLQASVSLPEGTCSSKVTQHAATGSHDSKTGARSSNRYERERASQGAEGALPGFVSFGLGMARVRGDSTVTAADEMPAPPGDLSSDDFDRERRTDLRAVGLR